MIIIIRLDAWICSVCTIFKDTCSFVEMYPSLFQHLIVIKYK